MTHNSDRLRYGSSQFSTKGMTPSRSASSSEAPLKAPMKAPEGGYGWVIASVAFVSNLFGAGLNASFGLYMEPLIQDLSTSNRSVSTIPAILNLVILASMPIVSAAINKVGFRPVFILGGLMASVQMFVIPHATNFYQIYASTALSGLGRSAVFSSGLLLSNIYFEQRRGLVNGIVLSGAALGSTAMSPLVLYLIQTYSWKTSMMVSAAVILFTSLGGVFLKELSEPELSLPIDDEESKTNPCLEHPEASTAPAPPINPPEPTKEIKISVTSYCAGQDTSLSNLCQRNLFGQNLKVPGACVRRSSESPYLTRDPSGSRGSELDSRRSQSVGIIHVRGIKQDDPIFRPLHTHPIRPGSRPDIYFEGDIRSISGIKPSRDHFAIKPIKEAEDEEAVVGSLAESPGSGKDPCPPGSGAGTMGAGRCPCIRISKDLLDLSFLKKPSFLLLCLGRALAGAALNLPNLYIPSMVLRLGLEPSFGATCLAVMGASTCVSRLAAGYFVSLPSINCSMASAISIGLSGVVVGVLPFCNRVEHFLAISVTYGLVSCFFVVGLTVELVHMYGIKSLTSTFGILGFFRGIGNFLGPFISGALFDVTGNYTFSCLFGCMTMILGGIVSHLAFRLALKGS